MNDPSKGGRSAPLPSSNTRSTAARIAGAVVGLVVIAIGVAETAGWPFLREPLARHAARTMGVDLRIDAPFKVRLLFWPGMEVGRLHVGPARGVAVQHLLEAEGLAASWRLTEAIGFARGGPLVLRALTASSIDAQLVRDAKGNASWDWVSAQADARPGPRIERITVEGGRVVWRDPSQGTDLRATIRGRGNQSPLSPSTSGDMQTVPATRSSGVPLAADRTPAEGYAVTVDGQWNRRALALSAWAAAALPLVSMHHDGDPVPVRINGRVGVADVHFDGSAQALLGERDLQGALRLSGPSLAAVGDAIGVTLPRTPAFSMRGAISHRDGVWGLAVDRADIGGSRLAGDFHLDTRRSPIHLDGKLSGQRLVLSDLAPSVGAGAATPVRRAGKVLPDQPFDLPSLRAMNADVKVDIEALDFGTVALRDMRKLRTALSLRAGVLTMSDLSADVAQGTLAGRMVLDGRDSPAKWSAQMRMTNVDITQWISAVKKASPDAAGGPAVAVAPADRYYVTGKLAAQIDAVGRGRSTAEILGSVDGRIAVQLNDGTLSHLVTELVGLDVAQSIGVAVRGDNALPLRCARVDFVAQGGVLGLRRALMDNADSTLRATGAVSLRDESLAIVARSRPKDFSPISLRAPITVTGSLSAPAVGVQSEKLLPKLLAAAALGGVLGPAAAVLPLLDRGDQSAADPCSEATAREQAAPPVRK